MRNKKLVPRSHTRNYQEWGSEVKGPATWAAAHSEMGK